MLNVHLKCIESFNSFSLLRIRLFDVQISSVRLAHIFFKSSKELSLIIRSGNMQKCK